MSGTHEDAEEMPLLSQVIDHDQMLKITSNFTRIQDKCYLENAGATLYPQTLIASVHEDLMSNIYMNPHSDKYTKDCIEQIRCILLKHFNTDSSNYSVVFTSGTTHSLKLIGESFQFASSEDESICGSFVYLRDNHTSVLGLRELVADKNADIIHISHEEFLTILENKRSPVWKRPLNNLKYGNSLLVYPAQSNFNGFKYPIHSMDDIRNGCLDNFVAQNLGQKYCNWYIMLDAASYVSTNNLDLSKTQPDFVCMSFYKIFGYPTGLGAILVKNSSQDVLNEKKYFGGGTVDIVLSTEDFHVKRNNLSERLEDGTAAYLSIIALKHCFDTMYKLIPNIISVSPMDTIAYHTFFLAKDLYQQLKDLKHKNGKTAAVLYMDSDFSDIRKQGGIVTFNLLRKDGSYIGYAEFQHMADLFNISVRTGCFCNSGSCQRHLLASNKELKDMFKAGHVCGDELDLVNGKPTGAIRVSFGYFNTFNDVDKLIKMICNCFVKTKILKQHRLTKHIKPMDTIRHKTCNGTANVIINTYRMINDQDVSNCENNYLDPSPDSKIVLKEAAIFPIKSCGAFKIKSSWKIGSKGFDYDREWMIVKDNGVCLTQKHNSRMCMIRPKIDLRQQIMTLHFEGKSSISIPLDVSTDSKKKNTTFCHSKVCSDVVLGYDCGDEVADWISEALEISYLRLIKQANSSRKMKKKSQEEENLLSLSNQAQFLLINKATVRWLKDKIEDQYFYDNIDSLTDRFRGNLVIDMEHELAERDWNKLIIGNHEFRVEGQCPRCQMVCIDQQTGEKTVEPLRTISEQFGGKLRFGIYLTYLGTVDGSKDRALKINVPVKPIINNDDISR